MEAVDNWRRIGRSSQHDVREGMASPFEERGVVGERLAMRWVFWCLSFWTGYFSWVSFVFFSV